MKAPRCRIFAVGLLVLAQPVVAVEPGLPSRTAIMTMVARAIATHDPDPTVRNPDWLAERFLGATELRLLEGTPWADALAKDYREVMRIPEVDTLVRALLVRTRFIDERLIMAVGQGATQVVILGAGFDSRAYRLREALKGVKFIEVDFGPTQVYKKRRVANVLGSLPPHVTYAPIDFTREKLSDVLRKAGHRPDRKSFFIWEGVTFYLPEAAVRETLRVIASQAPGSLIVGDFMRKSLIEAIANGPGDNVPPPMRAALVQAKRAADLGEPWLFGIPDNHEKEYLLALGLQVREMISANAPESVKRYRTRRDGTVLGTLVSTDYTPAVMIEAAVPQR